MSMIQNRYKISYLGNNEHILNMVKRNIDYSALERLGNRRIAESILHAIDIQDVTLDRLGISEMTTNATPEIANIHRALASEHWTHDLADVDTINAAIQQDLFNEYLAENLQGVSNPKSLESALDSLNRTIETITAQTPQASKGSINLDRVARMGAAAISKTITMKI